MQCMMTNTARSIAPILVRGFWGLMCLTHGSALITAWKSCLAGGAALEGLGACIALILSMIFFALKFCGVSWLRLPPTRRGWAAILLIVALIHADFIQPTLEGALASDCTAILATATLVGGLTQLPRAMRLTAVGREGSCKPPASAGRSRAAVWQAGFRPRCWVIASHLFNLRAPPICA